MSHSKKIGFAVIGLGNVASIHVTCLQELEACDLVAVYSRSEEKAKMQARQFSIPYYYSNYDDLLKNTLIDVVTICTPSGTHLDYAIAAAKAGKHVIVEKPLEITLERVDDIIRACQTNGVKLACIFQNRFNRSAQLMKKAIANGLLGKLILGDAYIKWHRTQAYYDAGGWRGTLHGDGGGALINQSIHTIDLLQWMMGPVKSVFGKIGTVTHKIEGEDLGLAMLGFENGALGIVEGSTSVIPGLPERLEIHGTAGTIILEGGSIKIWHIQEREAPEEIFERAKKGGASDPMAISDAGHKVQIRDMIDAIREDREPLVNGLEGRKSLEIVLAIYESSRSGKEIDL